MSSKRITGQVRVLANDSILETRFLSARMTSGRLLLAWASVLRQVLPLYAAADADPRFPGKDLY